MRHANPTLDHLPTQKFHTDAIKIHPKDRHVGIDNEKEEKQPYTEQKDAEVVDRPRVRDQRNFSVHCHQQTTIHNRALHKDAVRSPRRGPHRLHEHQGQHKGHDGMDHGIENPNDKAFDIPGASKQNGAKLICANLEICMSEPSRVVLLINKKEGQSF